MKIIFKGNKHYEMFGLKSNGKIVSYSISNNGLIVESQYQYFMILIPKNALFSGSVIQFSKLRFYKGENVNDCYQWCNDMINFSRITEYVSILKASGTRGSPGEELLYGLIGMGGPNDSHDHDEVEDLPGTYRAYGKMCYTGIFNTSSMVKVDGNYYACYACNIDAMNIGRRIDILRYNKWCWHAANDTYGYGDRNMKSFSLYMSNDRKTWLLMDSASNISTIGSDNYELMYSNSIYPHYSIDLTTGKKNYTTITLQL